MFIAALLHITLAMSPLPRAPEMLRAAAAEAAALWAPYGVAIDVAAPCWGPSDDSIVLIVVPVETPHTGVPDGGEPSARSASMPMARAAAHHAVPDRPPGLRGQRAHVRPARTAVAAILRRGARRSVSGACSPRDRPFRPAHAAAHCGRLMRPLQFADELVAPSRAPSR